MFTVEIKINGSLIAHVYGHNTGRMTGGKSDYDWHYYSTEKGTVISGQLSHFRVLGMNALIGDILEKVRQNE